MNAEYNEEKYMKFKPMLNRLIVKCDPVQKKLSTAGLIVIEAAETKAEKGVVVAVGPGKRDNQGVLIPTVVNVNDVILFSKISGESIKIEGQEYFSVKEDDIIGILK